MDIRKPFEPNTPETALESPAFPCNPRPFAARIAELCELGGSGAIASPAARSCLLILLQQSWGQLATVDSFEEYGRIVEARKNPAGWQTVEA